MELPIFHCPPERIQDNLALLSDRESHHALQVMRLTRGDRVIVVNGIGTAYRGEIDGIAGRKKVKVSLHHEIRGFGEPTVVLTLAAGLSVGGKFDAVVQAGTELGVKRFVPVITEKSRVRLDDHKRIAARTRRLERVALAAIKQCRRSYRPDIAAPTMYSDFIGQADTGSFQLIFQPGDSGRSLGKITGSGNVRRVTVLVGPEAGFTSEEAQMAVRAGFQAVSLGDRVLRTETAGPIACALIMNLLGELR